jgi:hypothetical protein
MKFSKVRAGFDFFGRFGLQLKIADNGFEIDDNSLVVRARGFDNVFFYGDVDPLADKTSLATFCKKLLKEKPDVRVVIYCFGKHAPFFLDNVEFIVLADRGMTFDSSAIKMLHDSKIIFTFDTEDKLDMAMLAIEAFEMKHHNVYLAFNIINYAAAYHAAKFKGCNLLYSFNYDKEGEEE